MTPNRPSTTVIAASLGVVLIIGLAYAATHAAGHNKPAPTPAPSGSTTDASLYLKPASGDIKTGETITVEIRENSGSTPVNAVQVDLNYASKDFSAVKIDGSGSAFGIDAKSKSSDGKVSIARGNISPLTGDKLVARITLTAAATGDATLSFAKTSAVVGSKTNKNIVGTPTGGTYTIR